MALISHPKNYKLNNLGPNINSEFSDYNPCLTLDENTLFFTSKRTITDSNEQYYNSTIFNPQDGKHFDDVYVSYRDIKSGNWGEPKLLDFCSADAPQATIAISGDGGDELSFGYVRTDQVMNSLNLNKNIANLIFSLYPGYLGTGANIAKNSSNKSFASELKNL